MKRKFGSKEIIKLLDAMVGETEAVGDFRADERRLDNLRTLIDVVNWCMDSLQFAMDSGHGRCETSAKEIGIVAQGALDEYRSWINDLLCER